MALTLTAESLAEFKQAFDVLDKEEKGYVNAKNLETMMETVGQSPSQEDLNYLMSIFGIRDNQRIDFSEFLVSMTTKFIKPSEDGEEGATSPNAPESETRVNGQTYNEIMAVVFKELGANGDNVIKAEELGKVMADLGERLSKEEIEDMIMVATNGERNGEVSFADFKKIVEPVTPCMKMARGDTPQVNTPQVNRPQVNRPQVNRPQVNTPQVNRPQVNTPQERQNTSPQSTSVTMV